jgi:hypothetical protein
MSFFSFESGLLLVPGKDSDTGQETWRLAGWTQAEPYWNGRPNQRRAAKAWYVHLYSLEKQPEVMVVVRGSDSRSNDVNVVKKEAATLAAKYRPDRFVAADKPSELPPIGARRDDFLPCSAVSDVWEHTREFRPGEDVEFHAGPQIIDPIMIKAFQPSNKDKWVDVGMAEGPPRRKPSDGTVTVGEEWWYAFGGNDELIATTDAFALVKAPKGMRPAFRKEPFAWADRLYGKVSG